MTQELRDYREAPFAYQDKPALRLLRKIYADKKITAQVFRTLRSLYMGLTEIASDRQNQAIQASDRTIRIYSGVEDSRTIRANLKRLVEYGLIGITNRRSADGRMSSRVITLLSTKEPSDQCAFAAYRQQNLYASNAHSIEDKGFIEIKENTKENISLVGDVKKLKEFREAKNQLLEKMSLGT